MKKMKERKRIEIQIRVCFWSNESSAHFSDQKKSARERRREREREAVAGAVTE